MKTLLEQSDEKHFLTINDLINELKKYEVDAIVLGQDNYFNLPPLPNDAKRKADPTWLGPAKEVDMEWMHNNLRDFLNGKPQITIPCIPYYSDKIEKQSLDVKDINVLIAEGTYTSLLRNADLRIFIDADYHDTLQYRQLRNRGNEVNDPFVESILETEHKIISGHKFLADIVITKDYNVIFQ